MPRFERRRLRALASGLGLRLTLENWSEMQKRGSMWVAGLAVALSAGPASAAGGVVAQARAEATAGLATHETTPVAWTSKRLASASAYDIGFAVRGELEQAAVEPDETPQHATQSALGQRPRGGSVPRPSRFFDLTDLPPRASGGFAAEPYSAGTVGQHFSTRRPPNGASSQYPNSTVGKLYFTVDDAGDRYCTAAVLRKRIVVTAGHCVHRGDGGASGFHRNFLFVPAANGNIAPFGIWDWSYVVTTNAWATSNGRLPNAADYGFIELADNLIDGEWRKVGDVTGTLGYQVGKLAANHVTQIGYPTNLDAGLRQIETHAATGRMTNPNNIEIGSDQREGTSGGPWVQNWGRTASGQRYAAGTGANQVVGVGSFGYNSSGPQAVGASRPDSRWTRTLAIACDRRAGNC